MKQSLAAVLIATHLGCMGSTRHFDSPGDALYAESSASITLKLVDGNTVSLTGAQIVLDSLVTGWTNEGKDFVGYPLTQITSVSTRERSPARTALLVGGIAAGVMAAALMGGGSGPPPVLPGEPGEEEEM